MSPAKSTSATVRLRRLVAMVPWLAANDGPEVAKVCERFGITEDQLQADLDLLTYYVGVPPYTPDTLFEVTIESGRVFARITPSLDRPLRLTPAEGLALVVAGRALGDVPGADPKGPLSRALGKVAALLQVDPEEAMDIDLGPADPGMLGTLRQAVAEGRRVEIDHYSESEEGWLRREVDPWLVTNAAGAWYLVGFDLVRQAERSFRLDRVREARLLDTPARPAPPGGVRPSLTPSDEAPRVVIEVQPAGAWVAEAYPVDAVEPLDAGGARITLAVLARTWLERLLARLGPHARVVDAPPELADAGRDAARRVLARYR